MDPRFQVSNDPRFSALPSKKHGVSEAAVKDDRFKGLLDDPDFSSSTTKKRSVDKRGFKVPDVQPKPARQASPQPQKAKSAVAKSTPRAGGADAEAKRHAERWARARGLKTMPSSDEESDDEEEGKSSEALEEPSEDDVSQDSADEPLTEEQEEDINEEELIKEWGIGVMAANPDEKVPLAPEATSRLALVDLDWDVIRAVDILAALNSFKPKTGTVHRVTVYPSDYGLERMADEAVHGPQALRPPKPVANARASAEGSSEEESEEEEGKGDQKKRGRSRGDDESSDSGDEVDNLRIRMYEQSKLRYYYAIAECDSATTASALYDSCDGSVLGRGTGGGCKMDLRFVPPDASFEGRKVRDTATGVPFGYQPPTIFSAALQHTRPTLTWDAEDQGRKKLLNRKMSEADIKDEDFRAYLASSSDEDDEEEEQGNIYGGVQGQGEPGAGSRSSKEEAKAQKAQAAGSLRDYYRSLLLGSTGPPKEEDSSEGEGQGHSTKGKASKTKAWAAANGGEDGAGEGAGEEGLGTSTKTAAARKGGKDKGDEGLEMEVTFVPGLESLKNKIEAKQKDRNSKQAETVWEAYLRRKKEKAKMRKHNKRKGDSSDSSEDEPPQPAEGKKGKGGKQVEQQGGEGAKEEEEDKADPFDDPFFNDEGPGEAVPSGSDEDEQPGPRKAKGKNKAKEGGPVDKKAAKEEQKKKGAVDEREAAELELLLMDDQKLRAGQLKRGGKESEQEAGQAGKGKKKSKRKAKRTTNSDDEAADEGRILAASNFKPNLADPRFADMLTNQHFALDPTDPRFRSGGGSAVFSRQLAEARALQQQRKAAEAAGQQSQQLQQPQQQPHQGPASSGAQGNGAAEGAQGNGHSSGPTGRAREQLELKSMVAQLKRKQPKQAGGQDGGSGSKRTREESGSAGGQPQQQFASAPEDGGAAKRKKKQK